ncbi:cytosol aminopeptidase isoform X2 [Rhipicephalus sanguineus]|uniref:cytosol aminopeptidase isoform X1 n=1 Tax=Rhipicephalus sanguineus TaxID=34632 RepID=UPI00189349E2|nr:cytosol aminopeptidase isoform X1 [Rhipicephalus sanguineus]XP_049276313.1 cytosol aminopeptidase isoform X2 [Rhipicephalus sanguineus]
MIPLLRSLSIACSKSNPYVLSSVLSAHRRSLAMAAKRQAVLLGVYQDKDKDKDGDFVLTPSAKQFAASSKLTDLLELTKGSFKKGETRIFYGLDEKYPITSVVHLGPRQAEVRELEECDEAAESVRIAVAAGVRSLRSIGATAIDVDPCANAEAAAEGCTLALHVFEELKKKESRKPPVTVSPLNEQELDKWTRGLEKSAAQNLARRLSEMPANMMTPTRFAQEAAEALENKGVKVIARDRKWIEEQKMGSFLSVTQGSEEPPVFLEMHYEGPGHVAGGPLVFVGKGVTFDSGGISLKPSANMDRMKADMTGAACVVATFAAVAALKLPVKMVGLAPLCENLPSGRATKPGDVFTAMNGTTIQVDNTDAEGRLILADALCYADTFNPKVVVDIATLTGAMVVALGAGATGVFCTSNALWNLLHEAGSVTGDRVWRMPLFDLYHKQMTKTTVADINNISKQAGAGGSCVAAAFLKEFVKCPQWAHLDIAGVMENKDEVPYLGSGMAGRPVRTLVEFVERAAKLEKL